MRLKPAGVISKYCLAHDSQAHCFTSFFIVAAEKRYAMMIFYAASADRAAIANTARGETSKDGREADGDADVFTARRTSATQPAHFLFAACTVPVMPALPSAHDNFAAAVPAREFLARKGERRRRRKNAKIKSDNKMLIYA